MKGFCKYANIQYVSLCGENSAFFTFTDSATRFVSSTTSGAATRNPFAPGDTFSWVGSCLL